MFWEGERQDFQGFPVYQKNFQRFVVFHEAKSRDSCIYLCIYDMICITKCSLCLHCSYSIQFKACIQLLR